MVAHALFFYFFSIVAIISAIFVIVSRNTVHAVFFLILDFVSIACLFIMIGAEFLGMMMLIVYVGAVAVLRGLRALSDFEYEFQMAGINARLSSEFETIFLMASENQQFVASRFVKEIHSLGGDVSSFVPGTVLRHLESKKK